MTRRTIWAGSGWAVLMLLAASLWLMPALAAGASMLTVSQGSVTIETGRTAKLLLSTENAPAGGHIVVDAEPGISWSVDPKGAGEWVLSVSPDARLTSDGTLTVRLLSKTNQRLARTLVKVSPKALPAPDAVAQAALLLDGASVAEGTTSGGFLAITNKSERALAVRQIRSLGSNGISVKFDKPPSLILPRQTIVYPFTITVARGRVPRTGTHQLVLEVSITSTLEQGEAQVAGKAAGAPGWDARILVSKEIELTVPGLSELQGALQIPSLLLLPGILAVIAFSAVLELAKPRPLGENPLSRLSIALSPGLWVLVIIISFVIGAAYVLMTGRNILYGFGIQDIVELWFASLVFGGLAGWRAYHVEKGRQRAAAAPRFAADLSPEEFLRQLSGQGEPLRRKARVEGEQLLFDLGPAAAARELWACGAIAMRAIGPRDDQMMAAIRDDANDALRMAAIVQYAAQGKLELRWAPFFAGGVRIAEPQIVSANLFKGHLRDDVIVQEAA